MTDKQLEEDLTLLEIMTYGSPVLKQKAEEIRNIDEDILRLAQNMIWTMHAAPGIGLAAPQVNRSQRLIVVDLSAGEKKEGIFILINPEILEQEGSCVMEEGCLSVPEVNEKVVRPERVVVKGTVLEGRERVFEAEGLLARVFCHEIDHLNGTLFIDRLSPLKKNLIKKKFKKSSEDSAS
jgi:peptide deformylase